MNYRIALLLILFISCTGTQKIQETTSNHFPSMREKVTTLPSKEDFYVFLLAGQSNMAGRGFVQPADTLSSLQVLMLNKDNEWEYAKEPLHYYEPTRTGLDCGLAFGKKLSSLYGKKITIGLVPCAIGGSSIEQWLGDSTYRNVTLYSNFLTKAKAAAQYGTIKGLLWHQGETNASPKNYVDYKSKLKTFFSKVRTDLHNPNLPVYAGLLAPYLSRKTNPFADSVNDDLQSLSTQFPNMYIVNTLDLTPLKDSIHFDSRSQRKMGERFAEEAYKHK
jgi:hypothetical protein